MPPPLNAPLPMHIQYVCKNTMHLQYHLLQFVHKVLCVLWMYTKAVTDVL